MFTISYKPKRFTVCLFFEQADSIKPKTRRQEGNQISDRYFFGASRLNKTYDQKTGGKPEIIPISMTALLSQGFLILTIQCLQLPDRPNLSFSKQNAVCQKITL